VIELHRRNLFSRFLNRICRENFDPFLKHSRSLAINPGAISAVATSIQHFEVLENIAFEQGVALSRANSRIWRIHRLSDIGFSVFSQWDDDGIISWLVDALPDLPMAFVEFGVENYRESNTRFLLRHRHWRGLLIEAHEAHIQQIRQMREYWAYDVDVINAFVTTENINDTIARGGLSGRIGLLSIDIDGNDYWIWRAIEVIQPDIVICEYNAIFGDVNPVTVPYDPDFNRTGKHYSNLYFGASVAALERLGRERGYVLIGCNVSGNNAYFIRKNLATYLQGRIEDRSARVSVFRESRNRDGELTFVRSPDRAKLIAQIPVHHLERNELLPLGELQPLYTDSWLRAQTVGSAD
jgi:hypothetical protein